MLATVVIVAFIAATYSALASTSRKSESCKDNAKIEPILEKDLGEKSKSDIFATDAQQALTTTSEIALTRAE